MSDTRERVLLAASEELLDRGWARLRMSAVATRAGTSRQTVYTLFPERHQLAVALAERLTGEFLDGVRTAVADAPGRRERWAAAVTCTLERAERDPLLRAMLGGDTEFLDVLTGGDGPIVVASRSVAQVMAPHEPDRDPETLQAAAETAVRLAVSHLVLPLHPVARTVAVVVAAVDGVLAGAGPPSGPLR